MEFYKSNIAYDGTEFRGFQRQSQERTVQKVLEEALRKIGWQGTSIKAAGRTDSGVHARGQVIAYEMDWSHGTRKLTLALNANLPEDVAVWETEETSESFHPRYSARQRHYRYRLLCAPLRDPLRERYTWRVWPPPDLSLMQSAAEILVGEYDFAAFGSAPIPGGHTIRRIFSAGWRCVENERHFDIVANAYLYHMVRRLTALMTAVGSSRYSLEELRLNLKNPKNRWVGAIAPPNGLCLEEVRYEDPAEESTGIGSGE